MKLEHNLCIQSVQNVQPTSYCDPSPVNQSTGATLVTILQTMQHQVLLQCEEQWQQ